MQKDYTTSTIKAKITSPEELKSIKIAGNEITIVTPTNEGNNLIYEIEKEVEENGNYKIKVETVSGRTNYKIQQVKDISEDMEIRTTKELVWFRDRVNNGATYKGRTITLINDLDLRSVCSKEKPWESIGKHSEVIEGEYNKFSGTFNGNNKTIDYLYIETSEELSQGLFGCTVDAEISGVIIGEHSIINAVRLTGGVVGYAINSTISNCGNNGTVTGTQDCIGGIVGILDCGEIIACYNKGEITGNVNVGGICGNICIYEYEGENEECIIQYSYNTSLITCTKSSAGGVVGRSDGSTDIKKCYNKGNVINGMWSIGGIIGVSDSVKYINKEDVGKQENTKTQVSFTCNIGNVNGSQICIGGICGENRQYCTVKNNYILKGIEIKRGTTSASKDIGVSSAYLGKYVGQAYNSSTDYIDGNGEITNEIKEENGIIDITNTVYYIVNGMSDGESDYWDKGNPLEPKLKWELTI